MSMAKRILIAEDQASARELLRTILSGAGYEVIEAADGDEAVIRAIESLPDLVLLDIHMPGQDGFSVCGTLRGDGRFLNTPIVAMTAGLMNGERERAQQVGFTEFLGKPISVRAVRELVMGLAGGPERAELAKAVRVS